MKLYIKYMVSLRCRLVVKDALNDLRIKHGLVYLGEVELFEDPAPEQMAALKARLLKSGLMVMEDKHAILIERVKSIIVEMVHYADEEPNINLSEFLAQKLEMDYAHIASLFSKVTGTTIEQYHIHQRVERIKELLLYDELNLTEIAYRLHFSSVAHLSNQFKKVTGLSPSFFKKIKSYKERVNLEDV